MPKQDAKIKTRVAALFADLPDAPSHDEPRPVANEPSVTHMVHTTTEIAELPIEAIQLDVVQVRYLVSVEDLERRADAGSSWAQNQLAELRELGDSLRDDGQIQPIRVFPASRGRPYQVLVGHRRLMAAQLAGLPTIQAIIDPEEPDELTKLDLQVGENVQRRNLNDMERALIIERYRGALKRQGRPRTDTETAGTSDDLIAARLGLKPDRMLQLQRLTRFAATAQELIIEIGWPETVLRPLHQAVDQLKLDEHEQRTALEALQNIAAISGGTLTNAMVADYVRHLQQTHRTARTRSWVTREVRHLADASRDVVRLREQFSSGQVIPDDERDTLRAALDNLQHEIEQTRRQVFGATDAPTS